MDTTPQKKKREFPIITVCLLVLLLLTFGGSYIGTKIMEDQQHDMLIDALVLGEYENVFIGNYDISTFSEEDFATYRGIDALKADYCFTSVDDINEAVNAVFQSENQIQNVYLALDPFTLWKSEKSKIERVQAEFEKGLLSHADAHPEITFEVLLSFPSMEYWLSLEEGDVQASLILYRQLTDMLSGRSNMVVYFPGYQEWLICNPANYTGPTVTNELVSQKIFLQTFCDHTLQITPANSEDKVRMLENLITSRRTNPVTYPDLSDWDIVFLGDSVFGNYDGSISVPGVVSGLSGATAFNCAQGGTSAAESEPGAFGFPKMVTDFISGKTENENTFRQGITDYTAADHTNKKLCFVLNYGLNDYFGGHPAENPKDAHDITSYAGALRTGIDALKKNYPEALIIIVGPGQSLYFNNGTDKLTEEGGVLVDYYELSKSVAAELSVPYMDLYSGFPEGDLELLDVLADGCHYNELGRYALGIKIIHFMNEQVTAK